MEWMSRHLSWRLSAGGAWGAWEERGGKGKKLLKEASWACRLRCR
jgi:hypothetical protein